MGFGSTVRKTFLKQAIQLVAPGAFVCALAAAPAAFGAQINYGTHSGTHVTYVNVTEDSGADEPLPLFGAPSVTGNSIDFNPTGFDSAAADGASDITASNLVMQIVAKQGSRIGSISLSEAGNTTLAGNVAPGTMATASAVFASGVLDILEVDFVGINHISVPFSMSFSPSGGTFFLGTDGGGGPLFNTQWNGSVTIPVDQILIANGFQPTQGATRVALDLTNTLTTASQLGTSAQIAKNDFSGFTIRIPVDNEVPEPAALGFVSVAALGLLQRVRRKA